jgi:hypothetical protein
MGQYAIPVGPVTWHYVLTVHELHAKGGLINQRIPLQSIEAFAVWSMVSDLNGLQGDLTPHLAKIPDDLASRTGQLWVKWYPSPAKVKVSKFNVDIKNQQLQSLLYGLGAARPNAFYGWGGTATLCKRLGVPNWTPLIGMVAIVVIVGVLVVVGIISSG